MSVRRGSGARLWLAWLLVPALAIAQVVVDTSMKLPYRNPGKMLLVAERNVLYLGTRDNLIAVLDCQTWQERTRILSHGYYGSSCLGVRNPGRDKAYYVFNPSPDSIAVIDTGADSVGKWLPFVGPDPPTYVSSNDRVYVADTSLYVVDCASDSFYELAPPDPEWHCGPVFWDSVGNKVYVGCGWGGPSDLLKAYDCSGDTLVGELYCRVGSPRYMLFTPGLRKAYIQGYWGSNASVVDTEADTVIRTWWMSYPWVDAVLCEPESKVYMAYRDTIAVIDYRTDSVVNRLWIPGGILHMVRTPWSNRLYVTAPDYLLVYDCRNDSLLVPRIDVGADPTEMLADEVNQRVYVVCRYDSTFYVFRDEEPGVEEGDEGGRMRAKPERPTVLRAPELARLGCRVIDALGRDVTDERGRLAPGVYFIKDEGGRLKDEPGSRTAVRKVIVQR